jgi:hypothetical protein
MARPCSSQTNSPVSQSVKKQILSLSKTIKKLIWLSPVVALVSIGCFLLLSCRNLGPPLGHVPPIGVPTLCYKADLRFEAPTFALAQKYGGPGQVYNNGKGLSVNIEAIRQRTGQTFFGFGTSEAT